jgi:hypothetical protein
LACHLQTDADPDPVPDPAYHFGADPDPDFYLKRIRMWIRNPDFYLMGMRIRMQIQVNKTMGIPDAETDPNPQHCF